MEPVRPCIKRRKYLGQIGTSGGRGYEVIYVVCVFIVFMVYRVYRCCPCGGRRTEGLGRGMFHSTPWADGEWREKPSYLRRVSGVAGLG